MAKIKLTKGELKKQRDDLRRYERFLPILQLKKQQLQMEILRRSALFEEKKRHEAEKFKEVKAWAGLLGSGDIVIDELVKLKNIITASRNIAGVDIPIFVKAEFADIEYDLYMTPFWVDHALESIKILTGARKEIELISKSIDILRQELRITTQRVNLFEKVKIPEAEEAIRLIKIYIGDQMANAVGRSKIAKRKIEEALEVAV